MNRDLRDAAEQFLGRYDPDAPLLHRARSATVRLAVIAVAVAIGCIVVGLLIGLVTAATIPHAIVYALYLVGAGIVLVTGWSGGTGRKNFGALRTGGEPAARLPWQYMLIGLGVAAIGVLIETFA